MKRVLSIILLIMMLLSITSIVSAENEYFPTSLYIDDVYTDIDLDITNDEGQPLLPLKKLCDYLECLHMCCSSFILLMKCFIIIKLL